MADLYNGWLEQEERNNRAILELWLAKGYISVAYISISINLVLLTIRNMEQILYSIFGHFLSVIITTHLSLTLPL